jgi:hypothetical protein
MGALCFKKTQSYHGTLPPQQRFFLTFFFLCQNTGEKNNRGGSLPQDQQQKNMLSRLRRQGEGRNTAAGDVPPAAVYGNLGYMSAH